MVLDEACKGGSRRENVVSEARYTAHEWNLAREILRYLEMHPAAKDTVGGMAQWWLQGVGARMGAGTSNARWPCCAPTTSSSKRVGRGCRRITSATRSNARRLPGSSTIVMQERMVIHSRSVRYVKARATDPPQ
jgi:hypothetical protein